MPGPGPGKGPVNGLELFCARCYVRAMEFGILGPLAVWKDGAELPLGGGKQRALLGVLVLLVGLRFAYQLMVNPQDLYSLRVEGLP